MNEGLFNRLFLHPDWNPNPRFCSYGNNGPILLSIWALLFPSYYTPPRCPLILLAEGAPESRPVSPSVISSAVPFFCDAAER